MLNEGSWQTLFQLFGFRQRGIRNIRIQTQSSEQNQLLSQSAVAPGAPHGFQLQRRSISAFLF